MKLLIYLLPLLITVSLAETPSKNRVKMMNSNIYKHETLKCVIKGLPTWIKDTTSKNYRVRFSPPGDDSVYVSLKAYVSREVASANGVYLWRSGSVWDRWHLLGSKAANKKANYLIGSKEKISSLYSKIDLDKRLRQKDTIVAEDIYIRGKKTVYIVTARAEKHKWLKHKDSIKTIMKSFYIDN
jgi:hypothetical protein